MVIFGVVGDLHRQAVLRTAMSRAGYGLVFCSPSEVLTLGGELMPALVIVDCSHGVAVLSSIRRAMPDAKLLAIVPVDGDPQEYASVAEATLREPLDPDAVRVAVEALLSPTPHHRPR
jgi:hypothetical protein